MKKRNRSAKSDTASTRRRLVLGLGALVAVALLGALGGALGLFARVNEPVEPVVDLFLAPTSVPEGTHWVLVGAGGELPEDTAITVADPGVSVLELDILSSRALAARLEVTRSGSPAALRVSSATTGIDVELSLGLGQSPPRFQREANLLDEHAPNDTVLTLRRDHFVYAFEPATEWGLSALRVHNRRTGVWHRRELATTKAVDAAIALEAAQEPLPEGMVAVDPALAGHDTDGDGILDVDEEPEPPVRRPEQIGIPLEAGENVLDIVSVDDLGNTSWRTLHVLRIGADAPAES